MNKVIRKVNNTLKPPNWTRRKTSVMQRLNSQTSPSLASNIDFHLQQLANIYKESGKKVREGTEPSLMEQLLLANPNNERFLTPNSSMQITSSLLSSQKKKLERINTWSLNEKVQLSKRLDTHQVVSNLIPFKPPFSRQNKLPLPVYQSKSVNKIAEAMKGPAADGCGNTIESFQHHNSQQNIFQISVNCLGGSASNNQHKNVSGHGLPPRPAKHSYSCQQLQRVNSQPLTAALQSGGKVNKMDTEHALQILKQRSPEADEYLKESVAGLHIFQQHSTPTVGAELANSQWQDSSQAQGNCAASVKVMEGGPAWDIG